jgi:hypothetical protein
MWLPSPPVPAPPTAGTYRHIEAHFELPGLSGNPFDYTENDIQVTFVGSTGAATTLPAFFDGGTTWRVRMTPTRHGTVRLDRITRNGSPVTPVQLSARTFSVAGAPSAGFVRRKGARFVFDSGAPYYPIGHNIAWKNGGGPDVPTLLIQAGKVGENWSRIWMNHWDNKNLDWGQTPYGTYSLDVARTWDGIVAAADRSGVRFQLVIQHHGPYSSRTDSNWAENPWNVAKGGFLKAPGDFFTDPLARKLTRAKLRYIVARWGYSPGVLAWELFNEVQWCDPIRENRAQVVLAWHKEMAAFLRAQDRQRHLVTTSSDTNIAGLYDGMDFIQPHAYPQRALPTVLDASPAAWQGRPIFYGEIGPGGAEGDDRAFVHAALWGSLLSGASGAAQYWFWDRYERFGLADEYRSLAAFVKRAGADVPTTLPHVAASVATQERAALVLAPGRGWGESERTEFTVTPEGAAPGLETYSSFLQGKSNARLSGPAVFRVDYARPGSFSVRLSQIARAGAQVRLVVDGTVVAEKAFAAAERDTPVTETLSAQVPAGAHTVRLENLGQDWAVIDSVTLSDYAPALRVLARANARRALLWVTKTDPQSEVPMVGTVLIPGLSAGRYRVQWWDTKAGKPGPVQTLTVAAGTALTVRTPPIAHDLAALIESAR